ncbi:MAG: hypothetical protein HN348_08555, partial [Proteobacteria bacterium]|nr:hypothetical protein [Pseudomonadota bacterium]
MSKARWIPGQSVARRLFRRMGDRPTVGPAPAFYTRLGLADPLSAGGGFDAHDGGDFFTFLNAAPYYDEVHGTAGSRSRLLRRIGKQRSRRVAGERLRTCGPGVFGLRPSAMLSQLLDGEGPVMVEPESTLSATQAEQAAVLPRERRPSPVKSRKPGRRVVRRHLDPAAEREQKSTDDVSGTFASISQSVRGEGRASTRALPRVRRASERQRAAKVSRALRQVRGPYRHAARSAFDEAVAEAATSPLDVAIAR